MSTLAEKLIKFGPILVMQLTKSNFFLAARGLKLDNGVTHVMMMMMIMIKTPGLYARPA